MWHSVPDHGATHATPTQRTCDRRRAYCTYVTYSTYRQPRYTSRLCARMPNPTGWLCPQYRCGSPVGSHCQPRCASDRRQHARRCHTGTLLPSSGVDFERRQPRHQRADLTCVLSTSARAPSATSRASHARPRPLRSRHTTHVPCTSTLSLCWSPLVGQASLHAPVLRASPPLPRNAHTHTPATGAYAPMWRRSLSGSSSR